MSAEHRRALELLQIADQICQESGLTYSLAADTLMYYSAGRSFEESVPVIYLALLYPDFSRLKAGLKDFCQNHKGYSLHDYSNTFQFPSLDFWFVKEPSDDTEEGIYGRESFYYGTRLAATPLFYAGDTKKQWLRQYRAYRFAAGALNSAAVLPGKPFCSYVKLTKKRVISNWLRRFRNRFSFRTLEKVLGAAEPSQYLLNPFILARDPENPNSLPWVLEKDSFQGTRKVWTSVKRGVFEGVSCQIVQDPAAALAGFPPFYKTKAMGNQKSQLLLEGGRTLRRVQQIQLELLSEFDRICRKHGLRYSLSFGTLLGAARHKGFIPWDDDIDVSMPWEDYQRLDQAVKKELDPTLYYYRTPETEEKNHLIFKHLEKKGTLYTKPGREKLTQPIGIFIDIFPMYPSAPNAAADWLHARICRFWRTALWATVGAKSEKKAAKRIYYQLLACLGAKRCYRQFRYWALFFEKNWKKRDGRWLKFWTAMDRNPYRTALVDMKNYEEQTELEFEGKKFFVPKQYRKVLDYCFGADWERYPAVCERTATHSALIQTGDPDQLEERSE